MANSINLVQQNGKRKCKGFKANFALKQSSLSPDLIDETSFFAFCFDIPAE